MPKITLKSRMNWLFGELFSNGINRGHIGLIPDVPFSLPTSALLEFPPDECGILLMQPSFFRVNFRFQVILFPVSTFSRQTEVKQNEKRKEKI